MVVRETPKPELSFYFRILVYPFEGFKCTSFSVAGRKARDRVSPAPNASPETADRWLGRGLAPSSVRFSHGRLPVFETSRCRLFRISQAIAASEMVRSAAAAGLLALLSR